MLVFFKNLPVKIQMARRAKICKKAFLGRLDWSLVNSWCYWMGLATIGVKFYIGTLEKKVKNLFFKQLAR